VATEATVIELGGKTWIGTLHEISAKYMPLYIARRTNPAFAAWPAALGRPAPPATLAQRPTLN
jgi:hypothetical protein